MSWQTILVCDYRYPVFSCSYELRALHLVSHLCHPDFLKSNDNNNKANANNNTSVGSVAKHISNKDDVKTPKQPLRQQQERIIINRVKALAVTPTACIHRDSLSHTHTQTHQRHFHRYWHHRISLILSRSIPSDSCCAASSAHDCRYTRTYPRTDITKAILRFGTHK